MITLRKIIFIAIALSIASTGVAQTDDQDDRDDVEDLKISAMEALISAPSERALPIVTRVLNGDHSDELKSRALFVLSQIDHPDAHSLLVETARTGNDELRHEAIRMIGIGGDRDALAGLADIYATGDEETREAVLEAYLIADDARSVFEIAIDAQDKQEFENAVEMLGAMGALEELRALRDRTDMSEVLIDAYAIAGDVESLRELALDASDPEMQMAAIHGLGITGEDEVTEVLVSIYRDTDSAKVKEAALEGLLISGQDEGVLQLFRESQDPAEKRELLETLVIMDSDAVWDIIDATLENR